jgi:lipopolysaccharide assembly outer membrane protein LptD (OstA)
MRVIFPFLVLFAVISPRLGAEEAFDVSADRLYGRRTADTEIVVLKDNVRIVHGSTVATADSSYYDKTAETLKLMGRARVMEGAVEVRGDECVYHRLDRKVVFPRGMQVLDSLSMVVADSGSYSFDSEVLDVTGNVFYTEGGRTVIADRVVYHRGTAFIEATGSVVIVDSDYGATLRAEHVTYDRAAGHGVAVGSPVLEIAGRRPVVGESAVAEPDSASVDSVGAEWVEAEPPDAMPTTDEPVIVHSDSMEIFADAHRAVAVGNVRILRGSVEGTGGRAIFLDDEDRTILTENPLLVDGESSLSGQTITMFSRNNKISRLEANGMAKSIYRTEGGETSELTGESVTFHFDGGDLHRMFVDGSAMGIFYPPVSDTAAASSRNEVTGETITITFAGREAESAVVTGGVKGTYRIQGDVSEDPVTYECNTLEYRVASGVMVLDGNAKVKYGNTRLHSSLIEYDSNSYTLFAPSEPVLWEGEDQITGSSLAYNLQTRRGSISAGGTDYEKGHYTGKLVRKVGERELNVSNGTYTTCEHVDDPHYSFTSSKMKVYVDDKVIVKPVVLRIRGMPVFWFPFYMFPIKRGRHSGILMPRVEFGFSDTRGRFVRNIGYYWARNDYMDFSLWGDYYEGDRWLVHLDSRYKLRYVLGGAFNASFTQEIDTDNQRWDLEGRHTQEIGDGGRLVAQADFVSDESYRTDTSENLEKSLRRILESSVSYTQRWEKSSLSLALDRKENLDTDEITQKLPVFNYLLNRRTLIEGAGEDRVHRGTYISGNFNFSNTSSETSLDKTERQQARLTAGITSNLSFADGNHLLKNTSVLSGDRKPGDDWCVDCGPAMKAHSAFDNRTDFTFRLNPWASFNINPSAVAAITLYDEDTARQSLPVRFMYWYSLTSNIAFYRTYFTNFGALKALRHVFLPSVRYTHRPDFAQYSGRFYNIPGISGNVSESMLMNINLENRFQAKIESDGDVKKLNNFLILTTSTTADFLYKDKGRETLLSTINSSLRFYPPGGVRFDITFTNDPRDFSFETLNLTTRFAYTGRTGLLPGFEDPVRQDYAGLEDLTGLTPTYQFKEPTANPWNVSVIYRLNRTFETGTQVQWLELQTGFNLSRNWRVDYSNRYDITEREIAYQEFSIYRDLHCWQARFVRRFQNGRWEYYFRVNVKAHPDLYTERGLRSLDRPY